MGDTPLIILALYEVLLENELLTSDYKVSVDYGILINSLDISDSKWLSIRVHNRDNLKVMINSGHDYDGSLGYTHHIILPIDDNIADYISWYFKDWVNSVEIPRWRLYSL